MVGRPLENTATPPSTPVPRSEDDAGDERENPQIGRLTRQMVSGLQARTSARSRCSRKSGKSHPQAGAEQYEAADQRETVGTSRHDRKKEWSDP